MNVEQPSDEGRRVFTITKVRSRTIFPHFSWFDSEPWIFVGQVAREIFFRRFSGRSRRKEIGTFLSEFHRPSDCMLIVKFFAKGLPKGSILWLSNICSSLFCFSFDALSMFDTYKISFAEVSAFTIVVLARLWRKNPFGNPHVLSDYDQTWRKNLLIRPKVDRALVRTEAWRIILRKVREFSVIFQKVADNVKHPL